MVNAKGGQKEVSESKSVISKTYNFKKSHVNSRKILEGEP